jgi:predicted CXXCH cytochrome family protein
MEKRYLLAGRLILLVIFCSYFGDVKANITGSKHDFSLATSWNPGGEICEPCHVPHNPIPGDDPVTGTTDAPLWNHDITAATFTVYDSPTLFGTAEQPRGPTKLCLSCHDGTVALDSFGQNIGGTPIPDSVLIDTDLSDDHPVSIDWTHQNDGLEQMCTNCHQVHPSSAFISELPFFNGYVECSSCHDTHNTAGNPKLLRLPIQGSQLCLHCHGK